MDLSSALGLVGVVLLVLANGFFVATEFAIVAVRRSRLELPAAEGHPAAQAARDLEDLVEALVGRMDEEPPSGSGVPSVPLVQAEPDGSMVFDGLTRLSEFEEITGLRLDEQARDTVETLGGLVMTKLGRMPAVGDMVRIAGRVLRVEDLDDRRVAAVRLLPANSPLR